MTTTKRLPARLLPLLVSVGAWASFVGVALATLDSVLVVAPALRPRLAWSRPAA